MTDDDLAAAAALLRELSLAFFLHEGDAASAESFLQVHSEAGMRKLMREGVRYDAAVIDGQLAGFIAMREQRHIFNLFVAKAHQGKGVARALWQQARARAEQAGNDGVFTVNASNFAVPVYEAFGFVRTTAETQCKNGIYFNPMQLGGTSHA